MRISELCIQAGIAPERGGRDQWGHGYEPDEHRFGFEFGDHLLCFRYRACEGSAGWFVNIRLPAEPPSLVFARISEADVAQTLMLHLWHGEHITKCAPPAMHRSEQQILLFGS
jgi:hypothetical protein